MYCIGEGFGERRLNGWFQSFLESRQYLTVDDFTYGCVEKFKYLDCVINDVNCREEEIASRIQEVIRCAAAFDRVPVSQIMSQKTKIIVSKISSLFIKLSYD